MYTSIKVGRRVSANDFVRFVTYALSSRRGNTRKTRQIILHLNFARHEFQILFSRHRRICYSKLFKLINNQRTADNIGSRRFVRATYIYSVPVLYSVRKRFAQMSDGSNRKTSLRFGDFVVTSRPDRPKRHCS